MSNARALLPSLVLGLVVGSGCAHPSRPYVFSVPPPRDGAIDLLARTLVKSGHRVSQIDRKNAEITTYWEDTGYRYRETDDLEDETSVFLRFHVKLADLGANHEVRVTGESERCVPYRAVVTATEVVSTCLDMPRILPSHQKVLNALGRRLSEALTSVPDVQPRS
jgi:hypothetical protein